jgi:hypothetical protein
MPFSYGCSDEAFLKAYPEADKSIAALCKKIRQERRERRSSRYGTPQERDQREGSSEQPGEE